MKEFLPFEGVLKVDIKLVNLELFVEGESLIFDFKFFLSISLFDIFSDFVVDEFSSFFGSCFFFFFGDFLNLITLISGLFC
jgi:hypothetical protein